MISLESVRCDAASVDGEWESISDDSKFDWRGASRSTIGCAWKVPGMWVHEVREKELLDGQDGENARGDK
jgi:hypothetical protein